VTRGDVYRVRFGRGRGHEQRGVRYGVIVQTSGLLDHSTIIVAPTSTAAWPATFRPEIELAGVSTLVMIDQLRALDAQRFGRRVRHLTREEQHAVDDALRTVLGL
jgi:mRNA interferase MazF